MKERKRYLIIILGILFISILGTFAWLTWKSVDTSLVLTIGDMEGTTVTLKPYMVKETLIPTLTYESNESINVTAKNNGITENDIVLYYKINGIDEELITDSFKYTVLKSTDGSTYEEYQIGNFASATPDEDFVIMSETVPANTTYNYKVYTWLDGEIETSNNIQGKSFKAELRANIYNGSVVTVDVPEGMIPVTLSNDGTVTSILETNTTWYNYNNKEWANGVLVTENSRSTYLNTTGVTIPEDDILAYYVYIPRYKYKIWTTGTSSTSEEQEIEILFENKYIPKSMGTQVGEYRTHPAFTFGSDELNGIWVGKFDTTGTGDQPTVKPSSVPIVNQTVSTAFETGLKFAGGILIDGTTSFSGSNTYGLSSNVNSHMAKNTEWAAISYLSHSKYGIHEKIRINNYYNNEMKTGCGANTENASESTLCEIAYGSTTSYPQSTTGNITGLFDMSGGAWERVMGVFANSKGTLWSGYSTEYNSGFNGLLGTSGTSKTDGIAFPESKYYNLYKASSGTTIDPLTACNGGYCYGHGLSEVSGWYESSATFISPQYPWIIRGAGPMSTYEASEFYFNHTYGHANVGYLDGFRSIITVNQDLDYDIVTDGLQLYYDGNNNTGEGHDRSSTTWKDLSGNGNNGTVKGAIWGSNYLSFDGLDDWVSINEMNYNNYTIEVIAMPTVIESGERYLVGNWETGGYGISLLDGAIDHSAYVSGTYKRATTSSKAVVGQKYHYVGTYDGSNLKMYINGELAKTTSAQGAIGTTQVNTIMVLGANPKGSVSQGGYYSGKIYMVRIYNRALSADEIKYNYEMDKEKYPDTLSSDEYAVAGLQLHYDGINNTGSTHNSSSTTWIDLSGNGNNGTINGATWGDNYLSFDGTNDWVAIKEMNYSNYTLEVTVMTTKSESGEIDLIANWETGGYGIALRDGVIDNSAYISSAYRRATTSGKAVINQKYHYIGTYDGSNLKMYINGELAKTTSISGTIGYPQSNTIMALGANPQGTTVTGSYYSGNIYSVRIYNRALTDSEILHNYNVDKNRFNIN